MKTAMQELINGILKNGIEINFSPYFEKEKQQLIDSYKSGGKSFSDIDYTTMVMDREAEQYYNETFKP